MTRFVLLCALLVVPPALAQTEDEKKATVNYLKRLRAKDGGYRVSLGAAAPSLRGTSAALRALKFFGGSPDKSADTKLFVALCKDKSGGYADTPGGKPGPVLTAVGLMAAVEVGILTKVPPEPKDEKVKKEYEEKKKKALEKAAASITYLENNAREFEDVRMAAAGLEAIGAKSKKGEDWLKMLEMMQNKDGTFGREKDRARETGGAAACIFRLGGKVKDTKAVLKAMDDGQREDGGFGKPGAKGSDLETTYRVMRAYHMMDKMPPRPKAVKAFVAKCRNKNGGYGVTPGVASSASATYFAGSILGWLDEK